jgi:hypothetical protein
MFYVILALGLFAASVVSHVALCRRLSKHALHAKAFIGLALLFLGIYWAAATVIPIRGLPLQLTGACIFILLIPTYLIFYVLTKLVSPSQALLSAASCPEGASYDDLVSSIQREGFIASRLDDLCISGCTVKKDDTYLLTASGKTVARVLKALGAVLGREMGG